MRIRLKSNQPVRALKMVIAVGGDGYFHRDADGKTLFTTKEGTRQVPKSLEYYAVSTRTGVYEGDVVEITL